MPVLPITEANAAQPTQCAITNMFISEDDTVFQEAWAQAEPLLQKALDRCCDGTWELEDVKLAVMQGRMQFWPMDGAALVTEILVFPRKKALNCWLCGGDLKELERVYPSLELFAQANGCYALYGAGRKGWTTYMTKFGWVPDYHVKKILE